MSTNTFHEFCYDQIMRLEGTMNFPEPLAREAGLRELVATVEEKLSRGERVFVTKLIDACLSTSKFCPTPADLYMVAGELRDAERAQKQGNSHESPRQCPNGLCDGSGWRQVYHLRTKKGANEFSYWESEIITREQYDNLCKTIDWVTQYACESRYRCKCHPASQERIDKAGAKYA